MKNKDTHFNARGAFENGKVVEAYEVIDDKWESIDLETLRKE